ncbi:UDP binding domain-containing protein [Blastococcus sp. TF02A-30]|uniref:UDP binding domain-containing protein n=1 Tax=Blastococcus sp. TF02A-30 TaxID=2250580 RepID=UPI001F17D438|nr:UDP binding domain-containing protein [Blastococcus sp. TF02A-30]
MLGAAFKPDSDDIRDSPALNVAAQLQLQGAVVRVTDPAAIENSRREWPHFDYADTAGARRAQRPFPHRVDRRRVDLPRPGTLRGVAGALREIPAHRGPRRCRPYHRPSRMQTVRCSMHRNRARPVGSPRRSSWRRTGRHSPESGGSSHAALAPTRRGVPCHARLLTRRSPQRTRVGRRGSRHRRSAVRLLPAAASNHAEGSAIPDQGGGTGASTAATRSPSGQCGSICLLDPAVPPVRDRHERRGRGSSEHRASICSAGRPSSSRALEHWGPPWPAGSAGGQPISFWRNGQNKRAPIRMRCCCPNLCCEAVLIVFREALLVRGDGSRARCVDLSRTWLSSPGMQWGDHRSITATGVPRRPSTCEERPACPRTRRPSSSS